MKHHDRFSLNNTTFYACKCFSLKINFNGGRCFNWLIFIILMLLYENKMIYLDCLQIMFYHLTTAISIIINTNIEIF